MTSKILFPKLPLSQIEKIIAKSLDSLKAEKIVTIDLTGKSDFADRMVIASGTSARHVSSLASSIVEALKKAGYERVPTEGEETGDWVLVDAGDVIVHIFKPETRDYYNLEKMWSVELAQTEAVL